MAAFDQAKFEALQGRVMGNVGGAVGLLLAYMGDQVGLYNALEESGGVTSEKLARQTGLDERYLREWLSANAALGYVDYLEQSNEFTLSPEQAALFSHESEPTCMQGFFQAVVGQFATHDKVVDTFKSGEGRPWGDHHPCCFCGMSAGRARWFWPRGLLGPGAVVRFEGLPSCPSRRAWAQLPFC